jgi:hypothetical protein
MNEYETRGTERLIEEVIFNLNLCVMNKVNEASSKKCVFKDPEVRKMLGHLRNFAAQMDGKQV